MIMKQNSIVYNIKVQINSVLLLKDSGESSLEGKNTGEPNLELSFEYLMAKEKLQWISIYSEQAILMSVCLQSMVDELLLKKVGAKIKQVI